MLQRPTHTAQLSLKYPVLDTWTQLCLCGLILLESPWLWALTGRENILHETMKLCQLCTVKPWLIVRLHNNDASLNISQHFFQLWREQCILQSDTVWQMFGFRLLCHYTDLTVSSERHNSQIAKGNIWDILKGRWQSDRWRMFSSVRI